MEKKWHVETVEECEKIVASKAIDADIVYRYSINIINFIINIIKSIVLTITIISTVIAYLAFGFKGLITSAIISALIYIIGHFTADFYKFVYNNQHLRTKTYMVQYYMNNCKELCDDKYETWQKSQMVKRFGELAGVEVELDNK